MRLFRRCLTEVCHNDMLTILAPFEGHKIEEIVQAFVFTCIWERSGMPGYDAAIGKQTQKHAQPPDVVLL